MYVEEKIPVEKKKSRDLRNLFLNALRIPSKSSVDRWRESTKLGFAILHQNLNCASVKNLYIEVFYNIIMYLFSYLSAILLLQSTVVLCEMFTALSDLEGLVSTELELVRQLDTYIQEEENKLKSLRRYEILSSRLNAQTHSKCLT